MRYELKENKIIVFEELKARTSFDKKRGVPKILIGTPEIINYISQILEIKDYRIIKESIIANYDGLPTDGIWIFEKFIEDEECGQMKSIQKISGNSKRSLKKESEI